MPPSMVLASTSRDILDDGNDGNAEELGRAIRAAQEGSEEKADDGDCGRGQDVDEGGEAEELGESCLICLGEIVDRTVLPKCLHSLFCFDCIVRWIAIHRRCPLCSSTIEGYIIHSIRSDRDYIRHHLPSLLDSTPDPGQEERNGSGQVDPLRLQADLSQSQARQLRRQLQQRVRGEGSTSASRSIRRSHPATTSSSTSSATRQTEWGKSRVEERQKDAIANWDHRLSFRRQVYQRELFCLHVGHNSISRLGPPPSHSAIATSKSLESNLMSFIRRDLLAYPLTNDVDFLSRYTIHVFKTFDFKSDEAIDLIAEFLGLSGAQHFCHEVYSFSRFLGDGSVRTAGAGQRDKVKAFDEWARYERVRQVNQRGKRNAAVAGGESGEQSDRAMEGQDQQPLRLQVMQGREKLLRRLEEEQKVAQSSPDPTSENGLEREHNLKQKLLLQRREAALRRRAVQSRTRGKGG